MSMNHPGPARQPKGFYKPRDLPHIDAAQPIQMITYRLADALPVAHHPQDESRDDRRIRIEGELDACHGACVLRQPQAARIVIDAWRHFDGDRYQLHAWVVMPNHVHVLVTCLPAWPIARTVQGWKSFTANRIHAAPGLGTGRLWQRDYWDRCIRDDDHMARAMAYIQDNPVKAGLARARGEWPWAFDHPQWNGEKAQVARISNSGGGELPLAGSRA